MVFLGLLQSLKALGHQCLLVTTMDSPWLFMELSFYFSYHLKPDCSFSWLLHLSSETYKGCSGVAVSYTTTRRLTQSLPRVKWVTSEKAHKKKLGQLALEFPNPVTPSALLHSFLRAPSLSSPGHKGSPSIRPSAGVFSWDLGFL